MCQPDTLDEQQRRHVEQIRAAHPDLETAYRLSQAFVSMLAERRAKDLDDWLLQAKQSGIWELKSFAQGIRRDYAAVRAAFTSKWSNGKARSAGQLADRCKSGSCSAAPILTFCACVCCVVLDGPADLSPGA